MQIRPSPQPRSDSEELREEARQRVEAIITVVVAHMADSSVFPNSAVLEHVVIMSERVLRFIEAA